MKGKFGCDDTVLMSWAGREPYKQTQKRRRDIFPKPTRFLQTGETWTCQNLRLRFFDPRIQLETGAERFVAAGRAQKIQSQCSAGDLGERTMPSPQLDCVSLLNSEQLSPFQSFLRLNFQPTICSHLWIEWLTDQY